MKSMYAKYSGKCRVCGGRIYKGDAILWSRGEGARHLSCDPEVDCDFEAQEARRERNRMDSEYAAGVADAQRYLDEKKIYGEALADEFALQDEFNRYWKLGEDY